MNNSWQILRTMSLDEAKLYLQQQLIPAERDTSLSTWLEQETLETLYAPFTSLKLAEILIFLGEYSHDLHAYGLGLKARGDALVQIGHYKAAMESLDEAGEIFLQQDDERNWARSRISWMVACAWLGNVDAALHEAERARSIFVHLNEPSWVCTLDNNIAVIYGQAGRYQDALDLYECIRSMYLTQTEMDHSTVSRNVALVDLNQAIDLSWQGRFEQAYMLQCRARDRLRELAEPHLELIAEINIADLDYMQGYYGSALRRYYQTLDTLRSSARDDPLGLAELKLVIANCFIKLNRADEARSLAGEAVAIYQQAETPLYTVLALITQAIALAACGRTSQAIHVLSDAQERATHGHFDHQLMTIQLQKVELMLEQGETSAALAQARQLREDCATRGLTTYVVRAELVMAHALFALSDRREDDGGTEVIQLCKTIRQTAHRHNLQEATYKSYHLLGRVALLHGHSRKAGRYYQAAIMQIERILDDLVYDLSPTFLHTAWVVYADMVDFCLEQQQGERAFNYLERARSMALRQYLKRQRSSDNALSHMHEAQLMQARAQRELKDWQERYHEYSMLLSQLDTSVSTTVDRATLEAEFAHCESKVGELFERCSLYYEDGLTTERTRKQRKYLLRPRNTEESRPAEGESTEHQTLLAYFLHQGKLVIFAQHAHQLNWHVVPDGVTRLEHLLPFLHARLQSARWQHLATSQQREIRALLHELYTLLIEPVQDLLTETELLTVVPYGPLHNLPFHALFDGSHFLIERVPIRYLPASSIPTSPARSEQSHDADRPLLFGYSDRGQLHYVPEEVALLTNMLHGQSYLEEEATIARLIQEAPHSPIIHIATHGQNRLDAPNFSSVLLADGKLNAIDVFNLNLQNCELVTLSGCETGLSMSTGGDEQLGLSRAFLAAGAQTLLISLWPVEDQATSQLMKDFYEALLRGESKVRALQTAQCASLAALNSHQAHPYYWAAFRLVGAVEPLKVMHQTL